MLFRSFLLTTHPYVMPGDAGEFQTLAATGGIAHAGYPALVLLLRLFGRIPISTMALRANLLSCFSGALAVGCLVRLALKMNLWGPGALVAGIALALSRTLWSESTAAGVQAFTLAIDAALFLACLGYSRAPRMSVAILMGALLGLGAVSHLTSLSLLPVIAVALLMARRLGRLRGGHVAGIVLGTLLGLLPLLYLVDRDRPEQPMNYIADTLDLRSGEYFPAGSPPLGRLQRVEWLLSARQYLGSRGAAPIAPVRQRFGRLAIDLTLNEYPFVGVLVALLGLASLARRRSAEGVMLGVWFLGALALVWKGASLELTPIFFLPGMWILGIALAAGLSVLHSRVRPIAWLACAAVVLAPWVRLNLPAPPNAIAGRAAVDGAWELWPRNWNPLVVDSGWDAYGRAVMARVEPGSDILACWAQATPLRYFQYAEPLRGDVRIKFTCRNRR